MTAPRNSSLPTVDAAIAAGAGQRVLDKVAECIADVSGKEATREEAAALLGFLLGFCAETSEPDETIDRIVALSFYDGHEAGRRLKARRRQEASR